MEAVLRLAAPQRRRKNVDVVAECVERREGRGKGVGGERGGAGSPEPSRRMIQGEVVSSQFNHGVRSNTAWAC